MDLKSFHEDFNLKVCGAKLQPVLENIKIYKALGIWVEVTTLIIPGDNYDENQLKEFAGFVKGVGEDIPWHITAFYPAYKLIDVSPTSAETLKRARDIAISSGLRYIYEGNIPGENGENTYCHNYNELLIRRYGFEIVENK